MNSILIVDDERGIRDSLRAVLGDEGFEVDTVASGEECLDLVAQKDFACILLDIWLGKGIDGLVTLKRLRDQGNDSAVVMISGHVFAATRVRVDHGLGLPFCLCATAPFAFYRSFRDL